jgi:hypothetical protein
MNFECIKILVLSIKTNLVLILGTIVLILLVENIGVEPMTSCVQGRRSSQLS